MSLVLDSSAALAWHFEDERTQPLMALLGRVTEEGATVPSLWRYETANGLQVSVRRKRISPDYRDRALRNTAALDIRIDGESDRLVWSGTVALEQYRFAWNRLGDSKPIKLLSLLSWSEFAEGESALAALYGLTVYDAANLKLAQRQRLPLASLDAALVRAAAQAGVVTLPLT
jgi:predicted nucleic acid-binding protein